MRQLLATIILIIIGIAGLYCLITEVPVWLGWKEEPLNWYEKETDIREKEEARIRTAKYNGTYVEPIEDVLRRESAEAEKARLLAAYNEPGGDLMFCADGSLRDPCPDDGYTAAQNYWLLAFMVVAVFFVWAGVGRGVPGLQIASIIFVLVMAFIICFVW